jgi:glycosyltransferase involved in cell wall biosynthesis
MVSDSPPSGLGVNVFGYFYAESGVGEHSRQLVETIRRAGIPYAAVPYTRTLTRQQHPFTDPHIGDPIYPIDILSINADELPHFAAEAGERFLEARYNIGLWAWEIEEFPALMARSQRHLDEIWANSSFAATAIQTKVDVPVYPFPLPVSVPEVDRADRKELGLGGGFVFLFCFDFDSIFERKNPIAVIKAFELAFPHDETVSLTIKTINGAKQPEKLRLLQHAASQDPRIDLIDEYWTAERTRALMASCDAYVSLHRAEGFGLTLAETMAYGKPVIATNYSGNLDFMNNENSYLVPATRVPIGDGCGPYPGSAVWSEPDVREAARLMQRVVTHPDEARQRGERARHEIQNHHSPEARSEFVRERLTAIATGLAPVSSSSTLPALEPGFGTADDVDPEKPAAGSFIGPTTPGESEAIANYSARLEEGPDLRRQTGLGQLGLWVRRFVFRVLRNYHLHQVQLGRASLLVMREQDKELRLTRQRLAALEQRLDRLQSPAEFQEKEGAAESDG